MKEKEVRGDSQDLYSVNVALDRHNFHLFCNENLCQKIYCTLSLSKVRLVQCPIRMVPGICVCVCVCVCVQGRIQDSA